MLRHHSITMIAIAISTAAFGSAAKDTAKAAGIVVEPAATASAAPAASATPATPAAKPAADAAPAAQAAAPASAAPAKTAAAAPAKTGTGTPCEEVKARISEKLSAKGVKTFTLDAVPQEQDAKDGKVVGSCEGGAKKIVYKKG